MELKNDFDCSEVVVTSRDAGVVMHCVHQDVAVYEASRTLRVAAGPVARCRICCPRTTTLCGRGKCAEPMQCMIMKLSFCTFVLPKDGLVHPCSESRPPNVVQHKLPNPRWFHQHREPRSVEASTESIPTGFDPRHGHQQTCIHLYTIKTSNEMLVLPFKDQQQQRMHSRATQ